MSNSIDIREPIHPNNDFWFPGRWSMFKVDATKTVADSYGAFNLIATLNGTIMFGWFLLALGGYLSGKLGLFRSIALGLMSALMSGVLKGTSLFSIIAALGLCIALVPLGINVLKDGPLPGSKIVLGLDVSYCRGKYHPLFFWAGGVKISGFRFQIEI